MNRIGKITKLKRKKGKHNISILGLRERGTKGRRRGIYVWRLQVNLQRWRK